MAGPAANRTRSVAGFIIRVCRTEEGWSASCSFPRIHGESSDRDYAINFVKGAVLHVVGDWTRVPDSIHFQITEVACPPTD